MAYSAHAKTGDRAPSTPLKENMLANRKQFAETGHLFGLETLSHKQQNPAKYETAWNMLSNAVTTAWETARRISASPIVREVGDCMWGLLLPTGEPVSTSPGIYAHFSCMGTMVQWMLEHDYELDPGINAGDIFENNCPLYAGIHAADVHDMVPIIYKDELVGWAGGVNHVMEVGGLTPGSIVNMSADIFSEGLYVCMERIGQNDRIKKEYGVRINATIRLPSYWMLDAKARVAGCLMIREKVLEFIDRYGLDYYREVTREFIEDSRRYTRNVMLTQSIPGRLRKTSCKDVLLKGKGYIPQQERDYCVHQPTEIEVHADGKMTVSLDGASEWLYAGMNCSPDGLRGALNLAYTGIIGFDLINHGSIADVEMKIPAGAWTWGQPDNPFASMGIPWTLMVPWVGSIFPLFTRTYFSRGYVEEVLSGGPQSLTNEIAGQGPWGSYIAGLNVEMTCSGMPARAISDGESVSWSIYNPFSDQGNAEIWEEIYPYLYLGRRLAPDSCGLGKYRGGLGFNSVWMVKNTTGIYFSAGDLGVRTKLCSNDTMYGSYPTPVDRINTTMGTNLKQLIDNQQPLVHERGNPRTPDIVRLLEGNLLLNQEVPFASPGELHEYDLIDYVVPGSQGFGDPSERDTALVKLDLDQNLTLPETVRSINGVVAHFDESAKEWVIDHVATEQLRSEIRARHKSQSMPFKDWWKEERKKVLDKQMPDPLQDMFRSSMRLSKRYADEWHAFWAAPDEFSF